MRELRRPELVDAADLRADGDASAGERNLLAEPEPERRSVVRLTHELRRAVGQIDRIDRPVQVRRIPREHELREQPRVERVVAVARRVARAAGHLRRRSLLLRALDGLLQRERRRSRPPGQRAGRQAAAAR
jgi:hypothetical protein